MAPTLPCLLYIENSAKVILGTKNRETKTHTFERLFFIVWPDLQKIFVKNRNDEERKTNEKEPQCHLTYGPFQADCHGLKAPLGHLLVPESYEPQILCRDENKKVHLARRIHPADGTQLLHQAQKQTGSVQRRDLARPEGQTNGLLH